MTIKTRLDKVRNYDYERLKKELKFYFFLFLAILLFALLIAGVIEVDLVPNSENDSLVYTVLNALIYGGFFCALGFFNIGIKSNFLRNLIFAVVFLWFCTGFGYYDFVFTFHLWFLIYQYFSLSNPYGLYFFLYNFYIFGLLYTISFATEREEL